MHVLSNHRPGVYATAGEYLKLLRTRDWVKNGIILLPLFFAVRIGEPVPLLRAVIAAAAFCLMSSAVYIFNDLQDIEADRHHPKKSDRPLASGRIGIVEASVLLLLLLATGLAVSAVLSRSVFFLALLYFLLNIAYSLRLKYVPILDVSIVAAGYVIRIFVGGAAADTVIFMWIVVMTFLLAMFIGLAKRRDDVVICIEKGIEVRRVVERYNLKFIDASLVMMAAVTIVAYIMYTISPDTVAKFGTDKLYLTTAFVILAILRYLQMIFVEKKGGFPIEILFTDRFIQICIAGWLITFGVLIYKTF